MNRDFSDLSAPAPAHRTPSPCWTGASCGPAWRSTEGDKLVGWVTSGTMVPYFQTEGEGLATVILEARRPSVPSACAYIDSDVLTDDTGGGGHPGQAAQGRGARLPYARGRAALRPAHPVRRAGGGPHRGQADDAPRYEKAVALLHKAIGEPRLASEAVHQPDPLGEYPQPGRAPAVRLATLPAAMPSTRRSRPSMTQDVFYYQGTKFIDRVEQHARRGDARILRLHRGGDPRPQRPDVQHGGVLRPDGLEEPPGPQAATPSAWAMS